MNPNVSLLVESVIQIKKGTTISIVASVKIQNNVVCVWKNYIWNPATCSCGNGKYLDSFIAYDEIIDKAKTIPK